MPLRVGKREAATTGHSPRTQARSGNVYPTSWRHVACDNKEKDTRSSFAKHCRMYPASAHVKVVDILLRDVLFQRAALNVPLCAAREVVLIDRECLVLSSKCSNRCASQFPKSGKMCHETCRLECAKNIRCNSGVGPFGGCSGCCVRAAEQFKRQFLYGHFRILVVRKPGSAAAGRK